MVIQQDESEVLFVADSREAAIKLYKEKTDIKNINRINVFFLGVKGPTWEVIDFIQWSVSK